MFDIGVMFALGINPASSGWSVEQRQNKDNLWSSLTINRLCLLLHQFRQLLSQRFMPKKLSVVHFCRVHNYQIFTFTFRSDCKKNLSTLTIWNWTKACACIPVIVNRISIHILKSDFLGHTDKFDLSCYIQRFILNIIKSTFHSTVSDGWLWLCLQQTKLKLLPCKFWCWCHSSY